MANQNKLKAYVRYDGTGRVIAGGPILQRFKPKVGNWVEIDAKECCNDITTTTTTTSTSTTTTTTTTATPTTTTTTTAGIITVSASFSTGQCTGNFMTSPITYPPGVTNFCDATTITSDAFYMAPNPVWVSVGGFTAQYSVSGNVGTRLAPCVSCG